MLAIEDSRHGLKIDIDRDIRRWMEDPKGRFYQNGISCCFIDAPMYGMMTRQVGSAVIYCVGGAWFVSTS